MDDIWPLSTTRGLPDSLTLESCDWLDGIAEESLSDDREVSERSEAGKARARKLSGRLSGDVTADKERVIEKGGELGDGASRGILGATKFPGLVGRPASGS